MDILNDPDMREIVEGFVEESYSLLEEMEDLLENMEDEYTAQDMEQFGQVVDRIMGAAKSIGADEVGKYTELLKLIGYKSSQSEDDKLIDVTVAVLFDATDLVKKMIQKIEKNDAKYMENMNTEAFSKRLHWLADKFRDIHRSSVSHDGKTEDEDKDLDALMKEMGL